MDNLNDKYLDNLKNLIDMKEVDQDSICKVLDALDIEYRICSECCCIMIEGYCIEGGEDYYCSDECLEKNMTGEEFNELYDKGIGDSYWTEWY